jgi:hypothetical protein
LPQRVDQSVVGRVASIHSSRVVDEAHAPDELHREKALIVLDEELVETRQVRVRHVGEAAELSL